MKKLIALALALSLCFSLAACGTSTSPSSAGTSTSAQPQTTEEKTYTLRFAMQQGNVARSESAEVTWVERFKEEVEANSNGRIIVEVYPSAQLGSQEDNVASLLNKSLEMTCINSTLLNSISPQTMLLACPALFANEEECDKVLAGEWGQRFWSDVAKESGIRVLAAFCNGMRSFTTSKTPLTTVESAKGITFRVMTSPIYEKMVEAIGANPVPMPGSEMYTAMQNGTVDGQENPPVNILNDKTYEVQKYMVLDKHVASVVTFDISESVWQSLPEDLQKVIADAAALVTPEAAAVCKTLNENGVAQLQELGMIIYEPTEQELEDWHTTMRGPCVEYIKEKLGDEIVDGLLAAIEAA
ncbi:MAG: TRAP transporter substrate-binding protein [Angelakisella sp.]|nr:TRAP transporter substrate-binding protein [Angelakisella sp.]